MTVYAKTYMPLWGVNDVGCELIAFSFYTTTDANTSTVIAVNGKKASVAYVSTGKYTVTMDHGYYQLNSIHASIMDTASTPTFPMASTFVTAANEVVDPLVFTVFTADVTGAVSNFSSAGVKVSVEVIAKASLGV